MPRSIRCKRLTRPSAGRQGPTKTPVPTRVDLSTSLCEPTPEHIFDSRLWELVRESIRRIRSDLARLAPRSAGQMGGWIDQQSRGAEPEDCFRGMKAHFLLMPWF